MTSPKHTQGECLNWDAGTFCDECKAVVHAIMFEVHDFHEMKAIDDVCWCGLSRAEHVDPENGR